MNLLLATACGAALALCLAGQSSDAAPRKPKSGFVFKTLKVNGTEYRYAVYVPRNYDGGKKWPLIMSLHGYGEVGSDGVKQMAQGLGPAILWNVEKWPFLVVFPQRPDGSVEWEQHDGAVMAILRQVRADYSVDDSRLYLSGLSQGGHGTWTIGANHPDVWAAIAPVCAYWDPTILDVQRHDGPVPMFNGRPADLAVRLKDTPVWAFHGDADTVVPVKQSQDMVKLIQAAGGDAKLTIYPGVDHNSWDKAYREEDLPSWFLSHQKTPAPTFQDPAPARSDSGHPAGFLFETLPVNGKDYQYVVYVPRGYDARKASPLIMFLHGFGESGTDGAKQVIQGVGSAVLWNSEKWPFLIVMPQKPVYQDQWEQHEAAVMAILEKVRSQYTVDPTRTYLTGLSQGGHGTWVIGAHHADTWAAISPICGYGSAGNRADTKDIPVAVFTGTDEEIGAALKGTPVWAFHGEADPVVPVRNSKDLVEAVQKAGGDAKLTTFPGVDHNSWDKAYREEDLSTWFLSHKLEGK